MEGSAFAICNVRYDYAAQKARMRFARAFVLVEARPKGRGISTAYFLIVGSVCYAVKLLFNVDFLT